MNSVELKYNFYDRALKGGTQQVVTPQVVTPQVPEQQGLTQQVPEQQVTEQQVPTQQVTEQQVTEQQVTEQQTKVSTDELEQDGLNKLNQQIPKTKVDFKFATIIGNLDQTLGSKQKINIDHLFIKQLFGSNY
jgi:hypothetical protein